MNIALANTVQNVTTCIRLFYIMCLYGTLLNGSIDLSSLYQGMFM
jgi:hypothetical protein